MVNLKHENALEVSLAVVNLCVIPISFYDQRFFVQTDAISAYWDLWKIGSNHPY